MRGHNTARKSSDWAALFIKVFAILAIIGLFVQGVSALGNDRWRGIIGRGNGRRTRKRRALTAAGYAAKHGGKPPRQLNTDTQDKFPHPFSKGGDGETFTDGACDSIEPAYRFTKAGNGEVSIMPRSDYTECVRYLTDPHPSRMKELIQKAEIEILEGTTNDQADGKYYQALPCLERFKLLESLLNLSESEGPAICGSTSDDGRSVPFNARRLYSEEEADKAASHEAPKKGRLEL